MATLRTRRGVRRVGMVLAALLVCVAVCATVALASGTDSLGNGSIGSSFGPLRSTLNRVFVHDQNGGGACEDAYDSSNNRVQANPQCSTGSTYHDFCGCATRKGEIFSATVYLGGGYRPEYMDGHQDY